MKSFALNNVKKFYLITALTNLWFITGSWLYFYRLFMLDRQIGILDGLAFGIGLIAEIPSGALADLLGRRKQLVIGLGLVATGFIVQGLAQAYSHIFLGLLMFTIGLAFVSGSDDALVYDSLESEKLSNKWGEIISHKYQIMMAVSVFGYLVGGGLYVIHYRLPFLLCGTGALFAAIIALTLHEVNTKKSRFTVRSYMTQNIEGIRHLLRRHLWLYAFMAFVILGAGYAFDTGIIKPLILDKFNFLENAQAIINALAGAMSIFALYWLNRIRKLTGEKTGLILLATFMALGFFATYFTSRALGLLAFLVIYIAYALAAPWLNDVVQHEVPSSHRATSLSALALLEKLPCILLAPLAGSLSTGGKFAYFLAGLSACIALAIVVLLLFGVLSSARKRGSAPRSARLT